ncbi:SPP1 gp16-like head completion protein [Halorubrum tailed virus 27]|uniref:SPP1 gp16-like head completion protein n=1 Tax=Halorubrum tailed virus 27 TaxID=2878008 RepID=A0AAE8Y159_9CAUD|nr:SPP1 gp16-like head completion protein [Halorubrum tailed virus 27]UBF22708.1 SPP1 gp16-like head completion protein [Halorubrum tailed virus 27]
MSLRRYSRKALATISRVGEQYPTVRRTEAGTDRYGGESYSWETAGSVTGVVFYGSRQREIRAEDAGRLRSDRPSIIVAREADLREDDRVIILGLEHRVDAIKTYPTHKEAALRGVTP